MVSIRRRTNPRAIGHLVRDDNAAFSTHPHTRKALVQAQKHAVISLRALNKTEWLGRAQFVLAVGILYGLAVLIRDFAAMLVGGIELLPIGGKPGGVVEDVFLAGLGHGAGADLDVLIAKGEDRLQRALGRRHSGGRIEDTGSQFVAADVGRFGWDIRGSYRHGSSSCRLGSRHRG